MKNRKVIFLVYILLLVYLDKVSSRLELCENGGVNLNNKCICPPNFNGTSCEILNKEELCTNAYDGHTYVGHFCCWSKLRTERNVQSDLENTNWDIHDRSSETQNEKLKKVLEFYGPFTKNDLIYLNHLFISNNNNKQLHSIKHNKINDISHPVQCGSENAPPLAFTFLLQNIDIPTLETLFKIFYSPKHYYILHVDSKNEIENEMPKERFLKLLKSWHENSKNPNQYPFNVRFMDKTFNGNWGSASLVYMEVSSYTYLFDMVNEREAATNSTNGQWSHVINVSPNDMPLVPLSKLEEYYCNNINTSYVQSYDSDLYEDRYNRSLIEKSSSVYHDVSHYLFEKYDCGKDGVNHYYFRINAKYGTQWHMLTYKFAHFLISDLRAIERLFQLKYTVIPDETYYQVANQIFLSDTDYQDQKSSTDIRRHTMWSRGHHKHRYEVLISDLESYLKTKIENPNDQVFFIRKVYDQEVKDYIINNFLI